MKKPIFGLAAFLLLAFFPACDDDENPVHNLFVEGYLEHAGFTDVSEQINIEDREFGIKFIPKVSGKIQWITMTLPDDVQGIRLTIWDADQKQVLETGVLENHRTSVWQAGVPVMVVSSYQVTAGKEYMITLNSNDWYEYRGAAEATYPIEIDNILVTGFGYSVGTDLTFPTEFPTSYFAGKLDLNFRTE